MQKNRFLLLAAEPLPFDHTNPGADVHFLCHLMAAGMFPSVGVIDARCHGSASGLSKLQLWQLFHLDELVGDAEVLREMVRERERVREGVRR